MYICSLPHHLGSLESCIPIAWQLLMDHSTSWIIPMILYFVTWTNHIVVHISPHPLTFLLRRQPPLALLSLRAQSQKRQKWQKKSVVTTGSRLPEPCPLPIISERTKNIIANGIQGSKRFFLLREAVTFYEGICPNPTSDEYTAMAKTLCHGYPELKDKGNKYWVSLCE